MVRFKDASVWIWIELELEVEKDKDKRGGEVDGAELEG